MKTKLIYSLFFAGIFGLQFNMLVAQDAQESKVLQTASPEHIESVIMESGEPCEECKPKPAPQPYKGVFYANDFKYVNDLSDCELKYYERFKQVHVNDWFWFDFGGEYRSQYKNENRRSLFTGAPSTPRTDFFNLYRTRAYLDLHFGERFRIFAEYRDAVSFNEDLAPLIIDENRSDLLNLFAEAVVWKDCCDRSLSLRVGRQELIYASQRLVSPLDWSNTRRTFSGASLNWKSPNWDSQIFWTRPVRTLTYSFDQLDYSQWFGGIAANYKGFQNTDIKPYFLILREEDVIGGVPGTRGSRVGSAQGDHLVFTSGAELSGKLDRTLWATEFAMQMGRYGNDDILAGMATVGLGRKLSDCGWKPTIWAWYDYASGGRDGDTVHTFNQLFPLAHKYLGFLDLIARQNIHDANLQFFVNPTDKLTLMAWQHFYWLADNTDGLYNAAGVVSRVDPTGTSGDFVGAEINLTATYQFNKAMASQLGYSYFWTGEFIRNTGDAANAHLLYWQSTIKF